MKRIKIFCEGITDRMFIADCLEIFFGITVNRSLKNPLSKDKILDISFLTDGEIIETLGCEGLKNEMLLDIMRYNTSAGGINLVIFDADFAPNSIGDKQNTGNRGFDKCVEKLEAIKKDKGVIFEYYLWHNNKDDGEIENLLKQLVASDKIGILNCFEKQASCLKQTNALKVDDLKNQISCYLGALKESSNPRERDYKDKNIWNIDAPNNNVADLQKFKEFLDDFFI